MNPKLSLERPRSASAKTVFLHIGMPKTGTTAIQAFLYSNRTILAKHGIFYPDFGDIQHVALARRIAKIAGSAVSFPAIGNCGDHGEFLELIEEQEIPMHSGIISSENFFQRPAVLPGYRQNPNAWDQLKRSVEQAAIYFRGCDVTVLMWLRRQDSWLMSMYNETIKTSLYWGDFNSFARNSVGAEIYKIVKIWANVFGRSNVVCKPYGSHNGPKSNIVDEFLNVVCPQISRELFVEVEKSRNISLSSDALYLKRRINSILQGDDLPLDKDSQKKLRRLLLDITKSSAPADSSILTNSERLALMSHYSEGNEKLVNDLGYGELSPLLNLDDLDVSLDGKLTSSILKPSQGLIDQLVKTFILPDLAKGMTKNKLMSHKVPSEF